MKSYTKKELAAKADVSPQTMRRWLQSVEKDLLKLGYRRSMRLLPPSVVKYVVEHFCIDV